eukprot:7301470-Heterocapsa_arctica.AAC.1
MRSTREILVDLSTISEERLRILVGLTTLQQLSQTTRESQVPGFVRDGINRARQLAWEKAAKSKPNYKGVEKVWTSSLP